MPRKRRKELVERTENEDLACRQREVTYKIWMVQLARDWQARRPAAEAGPDLVLAGLSKP